ncbi:PsbP-related protein [Methanobrevibacter sp.]|uniref:PsbP-related protein n=1 Tax=Methanobrevibacter sp. TaxID=66852 RepID=UPI00386CC0F5
MKKCPECGNPSYDGAPVCGNCGFVFPKQKVAAPKKESIFEKEPQKEKKPSSDESTINIIKDNKLVIGAILLITIIVIFGIVLTGSNNKGSSAIQSTDVVEFNEGGFSFKYPTNWQIVNGSDENHENAKFFENGNKTLIEYYNTTMDSSSLKDITQERISYAQNSGSYVELVETITVDGKNASNVILENADGNYTRFVSLFNNGNLYVFKIIGNSINAVTSSDINSAINSTKIA